MNELLQAWTRAGNAIAVHYEKLAGAPAPSLTALTAAPAAPVEDPKPRKPRAPKVDPVPPAPAPAAAPVPPAGFAGGLGIQSDAPGGAAAAAPIDPALDEKKSLDEMYKLAMEFVNKDAIPANVAARQAKAKTHYGQVYKVGNIKDLPHTQRLQFIAWLKSEIASPAAV